MTDIQERLRMNAYYYSFDETGVLAVDRVLSAVATAGKAYHHTDQWTEPMGRRPNLEQTAVQLIQVSAQEAADHITSLETKLALCRLGGAIMGAGSRWQEVYTTARLVKSTEKAEAQLAANDAEIERLRAWAWVLAWEDSGNVIEREVRAVKAEIPREPRQTEQALEKE